LLVLFSKAKLVQKRGRKRYKVLSDKENEN